MSFYRKKPAVIEARQFVGGKGHKSLLDWINEHAEDRTAFALTDSGKIAALVITTLEGDHRADIGDWIIKGVKGEFYPCKPDIFAATYEPAETRAPDPDLEAHTGAALAEAADSLIECTVWCDSQDRATPDWRNGVLDARKHHMARILALAPTALTALDRAKREARVEALNEVARMVDCGCDPERKARVLSVPPNSGDRWRGCGQANCGAMDAQAIRDLIEAEEGKP